jgi:hypothetical protein
LIKTVHNLKLLGRIKKMKSISEIICKQFNVKMEADAPHHEKYRFLINLLGYENVKECIPYSIERIKEALKTDEHMNNLPLSKWDRAAGFRTSAGKCVLIGSPLVTLYRQHGINGFSVCNGVCILKECARMWAEE